MRRLLRMNFGSGRTGIDSNLLDLGEQKLSLVFLVLGMIGVIILYNLVSISSLLNIYF